MTESTDEVKIHEFSTGIRHQGTSNKWVSLGFTGQYMNKTIEEIPYAVERSIANKEFAVAEGASSDPPAVIGRVVGSGDSAWSVVVIWSVVAIVTRGQDEKGRSASLYRYFLCEGDDSLPQILAWIEDYRQRNGQIPVFNPFETKVVGSPNSSYIPTPRFSELSEQLLQSYIFSDSAPVIIQPGQYNEQTIDKLATEKANKNAQPIAWAYNVEALEQLGRFQIIQAASARAYDLLQKAKFNTPQIPVPVLDEQAIKSAIKGLINSSTAKPEYVEAIANSLGNTEITQIYWRELFDGQGATNALKQGIYSPPMVRLLMLRAIVIPKTLPEYLSWLEKGNKQNDPYTVATEFDSQLSNSFSKISDQEKNIEIKVSEGLQILLPTLLKQKVSLEAVNRLLASNNGLWKTFSKQFIQNIDSDFQLMEESSLKSLRQKNLDFKLKDDSWQRIMKDLKIYWQDDSYHAANKKYQPFAEVFDKLGNPKISAFFYHVASKKVPKEIFYKLKYPGRHTKEVYGVPIEREVTIPEQVLISITDTFSLIGSLPIPILLIIVALMLLILATGLKFRSYSSSSNPSSTETSSNSSATSLRSTNSAVNGPPPQMNPEQMENALKNFSQTSLAINELFKAIELKMKPKDENKIKNALLNLLQKPNLDYSVILTTYQNNNGDGTFKRKWVEAIYEYEYYMNPLTADGIIYSDKKSDKTYQQLKEKLKQDLEKTGQK